MTAVSDETGRERGFVSGCCEGEKCHCGANAAHKVEETIFYDDPIPHRHPLTTYLCHDHFVQAMGPAAKYPGETTALSAAPVAQEPGSPDGLPFGIIDPKYAAFYTVARLTAWSYGYAIAMHGSFTRDLDLIAIPWTDAAVSPEKLIHQVQYRTGCTPVKPNASFREHGRIVWTLSFPEFDCPRFVDFSIIPPATSAGLGADEIARVFARWKRSKNLHESLAAQNIEKELLALLSRAGDQSNSTQKDGSR